MNKNQRKVTRVSHEFFKNLAYQIYDMFGILICNLNSKKVLLKSFIILKNLKNVVH